MRKTYRLCYRRQRIISGFFRPDTISTIGNQSIKYLKKLLGTGLNILFPLFLLVNGRRWQYECQLNAYLVIANSSMFLGGY